MKLFLDIFTNKDVFSDAYKFTEETPGIYKVYGKMVVESYDIDESKIGGNKSAEANDEDVDSCTACVSNLISANNWVEVPDQIFASKDDVMAQFKKYVKKVVTRLEDKPEECAAFKTAAIEYRKLIKKNHDSNRYFATDGDEFDLEGMFMMMETINKDKDKGDQAGDECIMYCLKQGLLEEKC